MYMYKCMYMYMYMYMYMSTFETSETLWSNVET